MPLSRYCRSSLHKWGGARVAPIASLLAVVALASLTACGGDGGTGPGALDQVVIDDPAGSTLLVHQSVDLRAVALDADRRVIEGLTAAIAWESSDPTVASVDERTGVVTAEAAGTATIIAKVNNKQDGVTFQVSQQEASVEIRRDTGDSVRVGDDLTYCAVVLDVDGGKIPGAAVSWTVSDESVASRAPATGECTTLHGLKTDTITVTAEIAGKQNTVDLRVIALVDRVEIGSKPDNATAGDCLTLDVAVKDESGATLIRAVSYQTSNALVATIDTVDTVIRACWEAPGSATITVESEGKSDSFSPTVKAAPFTVVGQADLEGELRRAFKWTADGGLEEIPFLPGTASAFAKGVNDNGQIVGEARAVEGVRHAFIYTVGRGIRELPAPEGASGAEAKAINNNGQVGGSAFFADGTQHLMVWTVSGTKIEGFDRGTPTGWTHANTEAINGNGTIVGTARKSSTGEARVYRATAAGNFSFLDQIAGAVSSEATGINTTSDVVGFYDDVNDVRRPFVAHGGNPPEPVDLPPGCPEAVAYGIDNPGRIAVTGLACDGDGNPDRGFIRDNGQYAELFDGNTQVRAMNIRGDVAGWTIPSGSSRNQAFVWKRGDQEGTLLGRFPNGRATNALALNAGQ
jgi:probable HAF family extracellular repeat protein